MDYQTEIYVGSVHCSVAGVVWQSEEWTGPVCVWSDNTISTLSRHQKQQQSVSVVGEGYTALCCWMMAVSEGLTRPVCRSLLTRISLSRSGQVWQDLARSVRISLTRPDQCMQGRPLDTCREIRYNIFLNTSLFNSIYSLIQSYI